jgi:hypothetical protein
MVRTRWSGRRSGVCVPFRPIESFASRSPVQRCVQTRDQPLPSLLGEVSLGWASVR